MHGKSLSAHAVRLLIIARKKLVGQLPFYVRSSLLRTSPAEPRTLGELGAGMHWTGELTFADAHWTMVVVPISGAPVVSNYYHAAIVFAIGLLLTSAVSLALPQLSAGREECRPRLAQPGTRRGRSRRDCGVDLPSRHRAGRSDRRARKSRRQFSSWSPLEAAIMMSRQARRCSLLARARCAAKRQRLNRHQTRGASCSGAAIYRSRNKSCLSSTLPEAPSGNLTW